MNRISIFFKALILAIQDSQARRAERIVRGRAWAE